MRCQRLMYAGWFMFPMHCASAIWFVNHGPLVTSYVIDAYLCLAILHAWTLEYQHDVLRLMVDTYEGRKASWRRPPGRPLNIWLNKIQEDTNALLLLRRGDLRSPWVTERRSGHLEYATTMMVMMIRPPAAEFQPDSPKKIAGRKSAGKVRQLAEYKKKFGWGLMMMMMMMKACVKIGG